MSGDDERKVWVKNATGNYVGHEGLNQLRSNLDKSRIRFQIRSDQIRRQTNQISGKSAKAGEERAECGDRILRRRDAFQHDYTRKIDNFSVVSLL